MEAVIIYLACGVVWGLVINKIIQNKGYSENWFWWGFFLGLIGLIVVACQPAKEVADGGAGGASRGGASDGGAYSGAADPNKYEHLAQIADLRKQGVLTDEEFEEEKQIILGKSNVGGGQRMLEEKSKSAAGKHDYDAMDSDDEYYDDEF